jgi:D-amino-acid dehydrogenase
MNIIVIGGGINGLSSAYYLQQDGHSVTILDKGDMTDGCSYGNMGYICPSHFIPLATPGIVKQGLKWMWNSKSPFYVQPRLNGGLINWGLKFMRSATAKQVAAAAIPLRDIALLSVQCFEAWRNNPAFSFFYEKKGMLEMFQTKANARHAEHTVAEAVKLGLDTVLLDKKGVQALEPETELNIEGAVYFKCDNHANPNELMANLKQYLLQNGVTFNTRVEVTGFEKNGSRLQKVLGRETASGKITDYEADAVVLAAGSWSGQLAKQLNIKMPLVGGRGYSITTRGSQYKLRHPAVLTEARAAITPLNGAIRFGGTMEITGLNTPPRLNRVRGIIEGVKRFIPAYDIPMPETKDIWYGYRPCSADGLPYIGKVKEYDNLVIATGHAMLGFSLGAATGKLVSELVNGETTSMNVAPFAPGRFA